MSKKMIVYRGHPEALDADEVFICFTGQPFFNNFGWKTKRAGKVVERGQGGHPFVPVFAGIFELYDRFGDEVVVKNWAEHRDEM